jgi:hypothetical protein
MYVVLLLYYIPLLLIDGLQLWYSNIIKSNEKSKNYFLKNFVKQKKDTFFFWITDYSLIKVGGYTKGKWSVKNSKRFKGVRMESCRGQNYSDWANFLYGRRRMRLKYDWPPPFICTI